MKFAISSAGVRLHLEAATAEDLADALDAVLSRAEGIGELLGELDSVDDDGGGIGPTQGGPDDDDPGGETVNRLLAQAGLSSG